MKCQDIFEIMTQDAHPHCSKCFNPSNCNQKNDCKIIDCINRQCVMKFHECKLEDHLNGVCMYQFIDCVNKCNGCKLKIKRTDMSHHLNCCVASVIRCSSFKLRNLWNKKEKFDKLKWPCPIEQQLESNQSLTNSFSALNEPKKVNINDIILKQDYESVNKFAAENPLIFHRLYGYLIGLDVSSDFSRGRFSFLRRMLKNVKSRIFSDIETENCVILNNEEGCLACRYRIRHMEMKRFRETRTFENRIKFYSVLGELDDYATFIEEKIYKNPNFIKIYNKVFNEKKPEEPILTEELSRDEIDSKLLENNIEILKILELNSILKVNVTKEMSCESFIEYDSYRLRETTYAADCDQLLRRDEFSDHYSLFHDFLLPNADQIDFSCPYKQYGCSFFHQKYDFIYGDCTNSNPYGNLVENDATKCLSFKLDYFYNNYLDENNNEISLSDSKTLMDLPFEVMYVIIDNLDSVSLFNLSMTCKDLRTICEKFLQLRGIVYPKWAKSVKVNDNKKVINWKIDCYAYTFSKHIHSPTKIKYKSNLPIDAYSKHFQNCPFGKINVIKEKFRIYPPLVKL